ncbi:MAG: polysaccharide deacetylase family protein, partial [Actinobacteria bacterium]|nr:polysaccharide deacetylase family protein [Actinomycetota bacterium]
AWTGRATGRALAVSTRWAAEHVIPSVCCSRRTNEPVVALTFDDGPHAALTHGVLDVLARHGAAATFFVIGERVDGNEDVLARIVAEGHELGNHLMHDEASILLPRDRFLRDLARTTALLAGYQDVTWWRPGSGWMTPSMVRDGARRGVRCALGTLVIADGPPPDRGSWREERLLGQVHAGSVIVLHEGTSARSDVVDTTDWLLDRLAERGLRSVTMSALSGA